MITISHTHADGTVLDGSAKGDGVLEIVRQHGFTWRRTAGIHIRGSRDSFARRHHIDGAADALRAAGHQVTVEIDDTPRPTAEREADREQRADARADRYTERATKAAARSEAAHAARHDITDHIPFGQPILVGHHSQRRAERDAERADAYRDKAASEGMYAREMARRAGAAVANVEHRTDPRVTMRRVERLETEGRDIARKLADSTPGGDWYTRMTARAEQIREDVDYWRAQLAEQAAAGTFVAWGPGHFAKGDKVNVWGSWHTVRRVNKKSVSVPGRCFQEGENASWSDTIGWDAISGRRRDGMQLDTPNGQPWPVEQAVKVARWGRLVGSLGKGGDREDDRRQDLHVRWAQRIAHGLDPSAAQAEVDAFEPDGEDTARALAAAYVDIFYRLTAGEMAGSIAANLPNVPAVEPAWRMPAGQPERMPVRDLRPGDIVAGLFDRWLAPGGGEGRPTRYFVGPVAEVIAHDGPDYSGERFVGWWQVELSTGESRRFKPYDLVAVHRAASIEVEAGPVEPTAAAVDAENAPIAEPAADGDPEHTAELYAPRECRKARKRVIPFNCKRDAGHDGDCSPYTIRLTTREQRGCCCPFPPGCAGSPCKSAGTYWQVQSLVRERYEWATASPSAVVSEDRRAEHLARVTGNLVEARQALRAHRSAAGQENAVKRETLRVTRHFQQHDSEARATLAASHRLGHRQRTAVGEHFYTHPDVPGLAFDTRRAAARAAVAALADQPTPEAAGSAPRRSPWADLLAARTA